MSGLICVLQHHQMRGVSDAEYCITENVFVSKRLENHALNSIAIVRTPVRAAGNQHEVVCAISTHPAV